MCASHARGFMLSSHLYCILRVSGQGQSSPAAVSQVASCPQATGGPAGPEGQRVGRLAHKAVSQSPKQLLALVSLLCCSWALGCHHHHARLCQLHSPRKTQTVWHPQALAVALLLLLPPLSEGHRSKQLHAAQLQAASSQVVRSRCTPLQRCTCAQACTRARVLKA